MAFDLDNEELRATRKLHGQDDGLYEDKSDKNIANIEDDIKTLEYIKGDFDWDLQHKASRTEKELQEAQKYSNAIEHILTEREQDKKKIQELEEENSEIKNLYF